ncbi:Leucine-rich repeat-containing protein 57 [Toxocara canis]|uniref:Leucine-rich repeat-containing protein 57 n=2 Tax=Toxocara canis TaxID=6265 RepID=A0A0B2UU28_TOXCA|nr:Leucine-rich repeat-containing protein 57 [Toxocara canis]VDM38773.1 unnamed protein product [Toxocara canis]
MGNDSSKTRGAHGKRGIGIALKSGPSSTTVQRHLENARKSRILQLKSCGLKTVPEQLNEVHEILRNLDLSDNRIRELPEMIGSFSNLKQLHLSGNQLQSLPDELGMLKKLEVLNAARNLLCSLPESFIGLCSLKVLNLSGNKFVTMPLVLCQLQSLDNLDMSINLLEKLPDEVNGLKASEVNLNQNRLSSLNENLARCERLKTLRVEENCLNKKDFCTELLSNSNISLIAYAGNLFQDKDFQSLPGYEDYQVRFTATKRKM